MKLRAPTRIAIGTALVLAAAWFGYQSWAAWRVDSVQFAALRPGRVNLVAVDPGAGYRVTVANQVAQLVEVSGSDFSVPDRDDGGNFQETNPRRIPIREMLATLDGDEAALSHVIAVLNDLRESNLPTVRVVWKADDIRRALDGDAALVARLERDLNVDLEGQPLSQVRPTAIESGIVIQVPVPVEVLVQGEPTTLVGTAQIPFLPFFAKRVTDRYAEKAEVTNEMIAGFYRDEARAILEGRERPQDIRAALQAIIDPARAQRLSEAPLRLFQATRVIVNDSAVVGASYEGYRSGDGRPFFDVRLRLTDEGRRRLWQYSRQNRGFQLLFVVDGIAIAAPRITTELPQDTVVIKQITDEVLVQDAVALLNEIAGAPTAPETKENQVD